MAAETARSTECNRPVGEKIVGGKSWYEDSWIFERLVASVDCHGAKIEFNVSLDEDDEDESEEDDDDDDDDAEKILKLEDLVKSPSKNKKKNRNHLWCFIVWLELILFISTNDREDLALTI